MKLLLDENLSRRVIPFIQQNFPGSTQISLLQMEHSTDLEIWDYAKKYDYVVVTKDADFLDMSLLYGQPPKIIWLKIGNQTKAATISALQGNDAEIQRVLIAEDKACVEIY
jgi:predicted nuclease of predicted toxin-antitoxin system